MKSCLYSTFDTPIGFNVKVLVEQFTLDLCTGTTSMKGQMTFFSVKITVGDFVPPWSHHGCKEHDLTIKPPAFHFAQWLFFIRAKVVAHRILSIYVRYDIIDKSWTHVHQE